MALSTTFGVLVAIAAIIITRLLVNQRLQNTKARQLRCSPPVKYPHRLPFLLDPRGSDLQRLRLEATFSLRLNKHFRDLFNLLGSTFEHRGPKGRNIATIDPDNFRTILALRSDDYSKQAVRDSPALLEFIGLGLFTKEGKAWKQSRDVVKPLFLRAELSDVDSFKKHVDRFMQVIPRDGSTINVAPYLNKLFLDSGSEFVFGTAFGAQDDNSARADELIMAFMNCLIAQARRRFGGIPWSWFSDKSSQKNLAIIHGFVDDKVARALAVSSSSPADTATSDYEGSSRYIFLNELVKQVRDPIALRYEVLNVFLPAFESTSIVLSNTLFHLARQPDTWGRLRRQALALGDQPLTFELLKSLHYFRYTVFESLRLHGSSNRLSRTAIRDTVLPRGGGKDGNSPVFVPKGTDVWLDLFSSFHEKEVWGDDCDQFRPDRFEGRLVKWEFVPFSGGARNCPAQQQVITQAVYFLVRMVQEFEVLENRDSCLEFMETVRIMADSANGVKVALHERP